MSDFLIHCPTCDGEGEVCNNCGQSLEACSNEDECERPRTLVNCDDCNGQGTRDDEPDELPESSHGRTPKRATT